MVSNPIRLAFMFPVRLLATGFALGWWLWRRVGRGGVWLVDLLLVVVIRLAAFTFGAAAVVGRLAERRLMARGWVPMPGAALRYQRVGADFPGLM